MELIISIIAICISGVTAAATFLYEKKKHSDDLRVAWTNHVIDWSDNCIHLLSKMQAHLKTQPSLQHSDKEEYLSGLSALIDSGRLRFENNKDNLIGQDKERAYQGLRPSFMNALVNAYCAYLYAKDHDKIERADHILKYKRQFVSDIQEIIEPKWFLERANTFGNTAEGVEADQIIQGI